MFHQVYMFKLNIISMFHQVYMFKLNITSMFHQVYIFKLNIISMFHQVYMFRFLPESLSTLVNICENEHEIPFIVSVGSHDWQNGTKGCFLLRPNKKLVNSDIIILTEDPDAGRCDGQTEKELPYKSLWNTNHHLQPWGWRQYVSPKRWYLSSSPHDVTTQKINSDTFTALRTSNLLYWRSLILRFFVVSFNKRSQYNTSSNVDENYLPISRSLILSFRIVIFSNNYENGISSYVDDYCLPIRRSVTLRFLIIFFSKNYENKIKKMMNNVSL
jgi:hypothetical protein